MLLTHHSYTELDPIVRTALPLCLAHRAATAEPRRRWVLCIAPLLRPVHGALVLFSPCCMPQMRALGSLVSGGNAIAWDSTTMGDPANATERADCEATSKLISKGMKGFFGRDCDSSRMLFLHTPAAQPGAAAATPPALPALPEGGQWLLDIVRQVFAFSAATHTCHTEQAAVPPPSLHNAAATPPRTAHRARAEACTLPTQYFADDPCVGRRPPLRLGPYAAPCCLCHAHCALQPRGAMSFYGFVAHSPTGGPVVGGGRSALSAVLDDRVALR